MRSWRAKLLFFIALLALWEGVCRLELWPAYVLPSPASVASSVIQGLGDGSYAIAVATSLKRIGLGYAASLLVGIPLGLVLGRVRLAQDTIGSLALGLQALPSICWLPLALLWFGLTEKAILFVVIMGAVFAIAQATADGVRNTPRRYMQVARTMGAKGWKLYAWVILPSALPAILSGMKLGWSFAWRSLMAGELLYVSLGLGQLLTMGRELNDMSQVVAVMLLIVVVGSLVDRAVFGPLERIVRTRWGLESGT
jgi:NitT/TauT family transport system permease protein